MPSAGALASAIAYALDRASDLALVSASVRVNCFKIYLDIYTLQERIAGHSSAFDGLRFVKECNGSD